MGEGDQILEPKTQNGDCQGLGAGETKLLFIYWFAKTKKFWTVVIQQLHDNVNVLNATELYTQVWSMLCISLQQQSGGAAVPRSEHV